MSKEDVGLIGRVSFASKLFGFKEVFSHVCSLYLRLSLPFGLFVFMVYSTEVFSEFRQTSKIKLFAKIVNDWKSLTIFTKSFILDVWQGSENTSSEYKVNYLPKFAICYVIACLK